MKINAPLLCSISKNISIRKSGSTNSEKLYRTKAIVTLKFGGLMYLMFVYCMFYSELTTLVFKLD